MTQDARGEESDVWSGGKPHHLHKTGHRWVLESKTVSKTAEMRRLERLAHAETANLAKRCKLPEMAADIIDRAGKVHGQKSRAIQIGVEILWRFGKFPLVVPPGAMETPLVGRSYKLPPRTVACIEQLASDTGMTQGGVLAAVAKVLAEPEPKRGAFK